MTRRLTEQAESAREVGPILETVQDPPQVIRIGDTVTITKPEFAVRVGYPISHADAVEWVKKNKREQLNSLLTFDKPEGLELSDFCVKEVESDFSYKYERRIVSALASLYLQHKRYGGNVRGIHTERRPEELGKQYTVFDKMTVKTGTYFPPSGYGEDHEPGGLANEKTHVLLCVGFRFTAQYCSKLDSGMWIERCNVRKVE